MPHSQQVLLGNNLLQTIDDLRYTYKTYSNQLLKVVDQTPIAGQNGVNGDFKDGSSGTGNDYVYDDNGNMVADLNKEIKNLAGANGIVYNHLDKPEQITIVVKASSTLRMMQMAANYAEPLLPKQGVLKRLPLTSMNMCTKKPIPPL